MIRVISFLLGLMIFSGLVGGYGKAADRVSTSATASPSQATPNSGQAGDVPEARALSEKVKELRKAGKYDDALPLAQRALTIREKALGPEHAEVATSLLSLGYVWFGKEWWYNALTTFQQALKIREKVLGPEHPDTAASLRAIALVYRVLGFYDRALPLAQRDLKITEKVKGPEHPDTADSMDNLAWIYLEIGAFEQALPLAQQALRVREKMFGPEVVTSASLNTLAQVYRMLGSAAQALPLAQRAFEIREKILGPGTSRNEYTLRLLGYIFLDLKNYPQSESCFRRTERPRSQMGLVELYLETGRHEEALMRLARLSPSPLYPLQYKVQYYQCR